MSILTLVGLATTGSVVYAVGYVVIEYRRINKFNNILSDDNEEFYT